MILPSLNEKVMQTKGICVPEYGKKGSGKLLIDILKELGEHLHVDKLVIFSLPEAKGFYEKVGLKEEAEWTNIMVYNFNTSHKTDSLPHSHSHSHSSKSGKGGKRKTKKSRNPGNSKTKRTRHTIQERRH